MVHTSGVRSWRKGEKLYGWSKPWKRDELHKISILDNKALIRISFPNSIYLNSFENMNYMLSTYTEQFEKTFPTHYVSSIWHK